MAASDARFQSVQSGNSATFRRLRVEFNPGLNVFIGTYPTGRTHPFKPLCASAAVSSADTDFVAKVRLPLACGPTDGHRQKLRAGMRGLADRGPSKVSQATRTRRADGDAGAPAIAEETGPEHSSRTFETMMQTSYDA